MRRLLAATLLLGWAGIFIAQAAAFSGQGLSPHGGGAFSPLLAGSAIAAAAGFFWLFIAAFASSGHTAIEQGGVHAGFAVGALVVMLACVGGIAQADASLVAMHFAQLAALGVSYLVVGGRGGMETQRDHAAANDNDFFAARAMAARAARMALLGQDRRRTGRRSGDSR